VGKFIPGSPFLIYLEKKKKKKDHYIRDICDSDFLFILILFF
jgi:hypothetical protein